MKEGQGVVRYICSGMVERSDEGEAEEPKSVGDRINERGCQQKEIYEREKVERGRRECCIRIDATLRHKATSLSLVSEAERRDLPSAEICRLIKAYLRSGRIYTAKPHFRHWAHDRHQIFIYYVL